MGTHNYTTESYNGNVQILNNSISRINQTILPSDPSSQFSMGYSVEVASFNSILSDLQEICAKTISVYEKAKSEVCGNDTDSAAKLEDPIHDFSSLMTTLNSMASVMTNGGNSSAFGKELEESLLDCTYEGIAEVKLSEYVTYDDTTGKYTYNSEEIVNIFKKKDRATVDDYNTLSIILSTMVDDDGTINTDALEDFLELAYTDGWPFADYKNAHREGTVLKELSVLMELKKNATAFVNKEYLQKDDIRDLTSEEKNQLKKIKSEIAICSIVIAAAETYDATSLSSPSKYKVVGEANTTTDYGLGIYGHCNGIMVEENDDICQLAKFDISCDSKGTYSVKLNGKKSYDVYIYSDYNNIQENIYETTNNTRKKKYGNQIKATQTMYTKDIKSRQEYTDEYVEKKITSWSKGKVEKAGKFIIKQIPVVSNVASFIEVAYDVAEDTYEWYTGYEEEVSETNGENTAINKMAANSNRYVNNLTSDNNQAFEDEQNGKCYTATYYYDKDELVVDSGSMIINEEAAVENKSKKESFN